MVSFGLALLKTFFLVSFCFFHMCCPLRPHFREKHWARQGHKAYFDLFEFCNGSRDVLLAKLVGQCPEEEFKT